MKFDQASREKSLEQLDKIEFDLCIIGGGITGAGVARDAASRGMKVCLLEQSDFASGTSSRSSKLIHGGIRYLENLEFGLVFEALSERHVLFQIAPHLVHPLTFILPVYESSRVGMLKLGLGMWLYDLLALLHAPKFHQRLSKKATSKKLPTLTSKALVGSYLYSDAYMDDDRLVIETLRSAHTWGANLISYVKAGETVFDQNRKVIGIHYTDLQNPKQNGVIRAKHFLSTVGPWTDLVGKSLFKDWKRILRPSKGIHLVLPREKLPTESAVVMAEGKRIIFAIPRGAIVIIGTTDTDFQGDPGTVKTEKDDVEYLLNIIHEYFDGSEISEEDVISSYAGVRPLVDDGSATESKTSREHIIKTTPHNITFVAGGKYTTYRRMARDIVETVLKNEFQLEERVRFARNHTREPINPKVTGEKLSRAIAQSALWADRFGLPESEALLLAQRHGDEALSILEAFAEFQRSHPQIPMTIWNAEALYAVQETQCFHLRDFMLRRTPLFLSHGDFGQKYIDGIIMVMAKALGWTDEVIKSELNLYQQHIKTEMHWRGDYES